MPTTGALPIPAAMLPAGPLAPYDWLSLGGDEFSGLAHGAVMRGTPGALAAYQRRQIGGPGTIAQGQPVWLQSRPYDRGAGAFSPKFGHLNINPIGAGIYAPWKLPVIAGPGARYSFGAIWFEAQTSPAGSSMDIAPTISAEALAGLMSAPIAAEYQTTG